VARLARAVPGNAPGDLFVDDTCIACDTCRALAPETFGGGEDDRAFVKAQPAEADPRRRALLALVACPVSAIGSRSRAGVAEAAAAFPVPFAPGVLRCGYAAESSFGAASWLLLRPDGNVLVDSPRFAAPLLARLRALGGVRTMFLTHRDDAARQLGASRSVCWWDWDAQRASIARLASFPFLWVLPGHGRPWHAPSRAAAAAAVSALARELHVHGS
jgi:ferredoxin